MVTVKMFSLRLYNVDDVTRAQTEALHKFKIWLDWYICLPVCFQDHSQCYEMICFKMLWKVGHEPTWTSKLAIQTQTQKFLEGLIIVIVQLDNQTCAGIQLKIQTNTYLAMS